MNIPQPKNMIITQENFKYIKLVKHQGNFFSIAGAPAGEGNNTYLELFFNFIDPTKIDIAGLSEEEIPAGDDLWTAYQKLDFPPDYVYVGSPLIKYHVASTEEDQPDTTVLNGADAPFEVLSDGQYIYIFRSSRSNQVYVDRFIFDNATKKLSNKKEVRFKRSQNKDVPLDQNDTLGPENLNGQPFIEPTTLLNFETEVVPGNFTVAIVPTAEFKSLECWQFFILEEQEGGTVINAYSIPRSFDGLFDIREAIPRVTLPEKPESLAALPDTFYYKVQPYDRFRVLLGNGKLEGLRFPTSLVYHCQEQIVDTYGNRQFVKRGGRVLLSFVRPKKELTKGGTRTNGKVVFLDFEIGKNGVPSTVNVDLQLKNEVEVTNLSDSLGMALEFNGKESQIISETSSPILTDQTTIGFWVYVFEQETPTKQGLLSLATPSQGGQKEGDRCEVTLTEERKISIGNSTSSYGLTEEVWNYVALTIDAQNSGKTTLYINGEVNEWEETVEPNEQFSSGNSGDFSLVVGQGSGLNGFFGRMANLIIWDVILEQREIKASMHVLTAEHGNQILSWIMGEGTGSTTASKAFERSPIGPKGEIHGARWITANVPIVSDMPIVFADARSLHIRSNILQTLEINKIESAGQEETTSQTVYVNTHAPVNLLESADGTIKCHFNQTDSVDSNAAPRFYSLSLGTLVNRSMYQACWKTASGNDGELYFYSVTHTTDTNETNSIRLIAISDGADDAYCTITFQLPKSVNSFPQKEVWENVPRDIILLNQVINGTAMDATYAKSEQEQNQEKDHNQCGVENILEVNQVVIYDYTKNVKITGKDGEVCPPKLIDQKSYPSHLFLVTLAALPIDGESAMIVPNIPVILRIPGYSNRWLKAPVPASISLSNNGSLAPIVSDEVVTDFPLNRDFTMEGWIRPTEESKSNERTLLAYDNDQELAFQFGLNKDSKLFAKRAGFPGFQVTKTEGSKTTTKQAIAQYTRDSIVPGDWNHVAVAYRSSSAVNLKDKGFIDVAHSSDLDLTETFTAEGWVRVEGAEEQNLVQRWDDAKNEKSWRLSSSIDDKEGRLFHFETLFFDDKCERFTFPLENPLKTLLGNLLKTPLKNPLDWAHVAVVFDSSQRGMPVIKKDKGQEIKLVGDAMQRRFTTFTVEMWLNLPDKDNNYKGKKVLSRNTDKKPILLGFSDEKAYNANEKPSEKTLQLKVNGEVLTIANYALPIGILSHLAVVYDINLEEPKTATVSVYQDGIELIHVSDFTGIIPDKENDNKWALGGDADGSDNFNGWIGETRFWETARTEQQIVDNMIKDLVGNETGLAGLYRFTDVLFTTDTKFSVLINAVDGGVTKAGDKIKAKKFNVGGKIRFYINGKLQKTLDNNGKIQKKIDNITSPLKESSANLWFGKDSFNQSWDDFRIWNTPRSVGQINYYKEHRLQKIDEQIDLVAWWPMNEGKGRLIADVKADHKGIIKGGRYQETPEEITGLWIPTPFGAEFTFYINGQLTPNVGDVKKEKWVAPEVQNQLVVGAKYRGRINELRIWKSQRTAQQIKGSLFNSISGKDDGLVAYYPFDTGSGNRVVDRTQNGFDLDVSDRTVEWTWPTNEEKKGRLTNPMVPISENHPEVVELSNEVHTQASLDTILIKDSAPDSMEIGNQRAFAYLTEVSEQDSEQGITEANLITDSNVGEVEMLFISQVRFDPTLIGYIEGAPPVPAENLSVDSPNDPNKYVGGSSVKLTEADTVTHLYSGSKEKGFDMSVDYNVGGKIEIGASDFSLAFRNKIDHSLGWINESSTANTLTKTQTNQLDLSGSWINNTHDISQVKAAQPAKLHEQPDRLYIPNNMGHALVRSKTADLFAVRLKRTGATLGYQMIPNPDSSEDFDSIMFKIKPTYIKNGSLDGRIGFDIDKDYKKLITKASGKKGSFFKPQETFALQRKIEREQQELQNYFDQFNASSEGRKADSSFAKIDKAVLFQDEQQKRLSRKNLVNSYVWTADGGLFTEEVQFSASRTETMGGTYSFSSLAGFSAKGQALAGPFGIKIGPTFGIDALFGGHINTKISKSETIGLDFSIDSVATGEDFLNRMAPALVANKTLDLLDRDSYVNSIKALNKGDVDPNLMGLINTPVTILSDDALSKPIASGDRWKLIGDDTMFILKNTHKIKANTFELTQVRNGLFPVNYAASALPGKVKSYRYKTFYLAPNKDNFTNFKDIVDEDWLKSAEPDAVALVKALVNTNEVWRVLHRVTSVSRVAPDPGNAFVQSEEVPDLTIVEPDQGSQVANVSVVRKFDQTEIDQTKDDQADDALKEETLKKDTLREFSKEMSDTLSKLAEGESEFGTMDQENTLLLLMKYAEALQMKEKELVELENKEG